MNEVHLPGIDLNLLVALDALLRERHVTRAARRVGLSQSALSHALGRLRELFDDPLLVRGRSGMVTTARAEALDVPLREALERLEGLIGAPPVFDPATARITLRVACEDYVSTLLLPTLLARLREEAPQVDLDVLSTRPPDLAARLEDKSIDLAIGVFRSPAASLRTQHLFSDGFACVVREGHPRVKRRLTLRQMVTLPHALIGVGERGPAPVDDALAALGHERRVALRITHFLAAPMIVAETDLVLTLPRRLAERLATMTPLVVHAPPLALAPFDFHQVWHERRQRDPAHAWFRALVADVAREVTSGD